MGSGFRGFRVQGLGLPRKNKMFPAEYKHVMGLSSIGEGSTDCQTLSPEKHAKSFDIPATVIPHMTKTSAELPSLH